jgi:hypothetical protein
LYVVVDILDTAKPTVDVAMNSTFVDIQSVPTEPWDHNRQNAVTPRERVTVVDVRVPHVGSRM